MRQQVGDEEQGALSHGAFVSPGCIRPSLGEAALDIVDGRGLGVAAECIPQVGVVGEVLGLVEAVGRAALRAAGAQEMLLARGGVGAERLDQVAVAGDLLQPVEGRLVLSR
jgi:hypothetical protein